MSIPSAHLIPSASNARRKRAGVSAGRLAALLGGNGLLLILIVLVAVFAWLSPYFLTTDNLLAIGAGSAVLGLMAIAQTYVIVARGMDVSVGAVVALAGVVLGLLVAAEINVWIACIVVLLVGAGIGTINGAIVVKLGINPLITTLGTLSLFSGLAYVVSGNSTLIIDDSGFAYLGTGQIFNVPVPLVLFLIAVLVAAFVERRTVVGRAIYAIGGNPEAARMAGLRVNAIPMGLYVVSGLAAACAGLVITSQLAAASPQVGSTYLLNVVTAVVLGGTSLAGGRGSVWGTLVAVFILGVLQNGFALLQISSFAQTMALGAALILAVLLDQSTQRLRVRARA